jgi:glycosyltransferase involved in cell wall biosynthesis
VMIPTWEPDPHHLGEALRSVLAQAREREAFQVAIVDDASTRFDGEAFLRAMGATDVTFHRHRRHLGIADNWNRCLQLARGQRIHVLHQDDFVRDGFYARVGAGLDNHPEAGAAFVQPAYVDATGRPLPIGVQVADHPGILDDWLEHIFVGLKFACVGVVVRRSVYERLGGFDSQFRYCLDWDMWQRIAVSTPIWYESARLACCRFHATSATQRLRRSGRTLVEIAQSIERGRAYLDPVTGSSVADRARANYTEWALRGARALLRDGQPLTALVQVWGLRHLSSRAVVLRALVEGGRAQWRRWRGRAGRARS